MPITAPRPTPDPAAAAGGLTPARDRLARAARYASVTVIAVALYAAIDLTLVFLRPQFSILYNAESDYGSHGSWAWLMDLNFLLRCVLSLAAIAALSEIEAGRRRSTGFRVGLVLVGVWAVGSGLLAFFPDDPVGTPTHGSGQVHLAIAGIALPAVLVGTILISMALRREPFWRPVARPMAVLSWGAIVPMLLLLHTHLRRHQPGGLYEKVFLGMELLWLALVAARILVAARESAAANAVASRRAR
jgi:hypothetical protein